MDFLRPSKKRKQKFQLFVGYALVAVALAIATLIIVFINLGFDIDPKTGDVIRKGLVVFDGHPESAQIILNGQNRGTTKARYVLPEGDYSAELKRDGYRSWFHDFRLEGGSIEQLVYPFLFPANLVTNSIEEYKANPGMSSQSPDRRWMVVQQPDKLGSFDLIDLNDKENPTETIALPSDTLTQATGSHSLEAIEWSSDNDHLLIKHSWPKGSEFIMVSRADPLESTNITKLFSDEDVTAITLRDKKADSLYLFDAETGALKTAQVNSRQVSQVAKDVLSYKSYRDDFVLYTKKDESDKKLAQVRILQDKQDYLLRRVPIGKTYLLQAASFDGIFYVTTGSQSDGRVYIYKNPVNDLRANSTPPSPFRVLIVPSARYISFSQNTRFVVVQNGSDFAIYDAETDRQFTYTSPLVIDPNQQAQWMDGHRLVVVSDKKTHVFDFDNQNLQTLQAAHPAYIPVFNRDYDAMFNLVPATDKTYQLTRTELRVEPQQ